MAKISRVPVIGHDDSGVEFIHVVVRSFTIDVEGILWIRALFSIAEMGQCWTSAPRLKIRFPVQVFCLHEGNVLFFRGRTDDDICRDWFIVIDFDEIPDFNVLPSSFAPTRVPLVMPPTKQVTAMVVLFMSLDTVGGIVVFVSVVIGLFGGLMIADCLWGSRTPLHFNIPGLRNLGFLPKRARDQATNKGSALLSCDVFVDKVSTFQYPYDGRIDAPV